MNHNRVGLEREIQELIDSFKIALIEIMKAGMNIEDAIVEVDAEVIRDMIEMFELALSRLEGGGANCTRSC